MPTYQYACTACDERLEAVQSFTDAPLTQCTACGGALRKVFSAVGVVFKGSGFYKTDSRGKATDAPKSDPKADKAGGDKGSGDKGGDKVAATTTAKGSDSSSTSSAPAASAPASKSA